MTKLRTLLVDDEAPVLRRMRRLLRAHTELEIVGEAVSVASARRAIEDLDPDLMFLDVQLPDGSSLSIFDREVRAQVIFVTAHDAYALRAFEVNALDYLLKPVTPERLARAIKRARGSAASPLIPVTTSDLVSVRSARGTRLISVSAITHITALDDYSEVHTQEGEVVLCLNALGAWAERLPATFMRIHRSTIVDAARIERVFLSGSVLHVCLRDEEAPLVVGKTYRQAIEEWLARATKRQRV